MRRNKPTLTFWWPHMTRVKFSKTLTSAAGHGVLPGRVPLMVAWGILVPSMWRGQREHAASFLPGGHTG